MPTDDPIQYLTEMGLTNAEARIYLTALKLGGGTAKEISVAAEMERAYTYHTLRRLEDLGIVEATLDSPIRFKSLRPEEAIDHVLSIQSTKLDRLKQLRESLMQSILFHSQDKVHSNETFSVITGRVNNRLRAINTIRTCESEIFMLQSAQGLSRLWRSDDFLDSIKQKRDQKIRIRMVSEILPENNDAAAKEFGLLCDLRSARNQVANATIYDRRICSIVLHIGEDLRSDSPEHTALWTNSKSFINTMCNFFESIWRVAKPYKVSSEQAVSLRQRSRY